MFTNLRKITVIALAVLAVSEVCSAKTPAGWLQILKADFPAGTYEGKNLSGERCKVELRHFRRHSSKPGLEAILVTYPKGEDFPKVWSMTMDPLKDKIHVDTEGDSLFLEKSKTIKQDGDYKVDVYEKLESMAGRNGIAAFYFHVAEVDYESDPHEDMGECAVGR